MNVIKDNLVEFLSTKNSMWIGKIRWFSYLLLFFSAFSYARVIPRAVSFPLNALTIVFVLILFVFFIFASISGLNQVPGDSINYLYLAGVYLVLLHVGILCGFLFSGEIESVLWVRDSYGMHVPGALNISRYLVGSEGLRMLTTPFDKIYFTHILVGMFFALLGDNPVASGIALLAARIGTVYFIFKLAKEMFDPKVAAISVFSYVFMPTLLFYTTTYYKEAVVQLIVSAVVFCVYRIVNGNATYKVYSLLLVSLALIANERFYLFPMFLIALFLAFFWTVKKVKRGTFTLISALTIFSGALFFYKYSSWLCSHSLNIFAFFSDLRVAYTQYPDVAPTNAVVPYWKGIAKILFTPFFTVNKFKIFSKYSHILIWGSFFSQIVVAMGLYGMFSSFKIDFKKHVVIVLPYVMFVLLFAYIAPYNGRLRDSFYPVIAVYAACSFKKIYDYLIRNRQASARMNSHSSYVQFFPTIMHYGNISPSKCEGE